MKTKYLILVFITASFLSSSLGQSKNVIKVRMLKPTSDQTIPSSHTLYNSQALNPGQELFRTEYDYMCNNSIDNMIDLFDLDGDGDLDPLMSGMQRFGAGTQRTVRFAYITSGNPPAHFSAFDTTTTTSGSNTYGWGNIQVCVGGAWDGNALMFAHSNGDSYWSLIDLVNYTPITPFSTVSIPGNFPSFVYLNGGTILMNNTNFIFYRSTDYGQTFDSLFVIGNGDPNFSLISATNTPSESPIWKSDDGMYISSTWVGDGGVAPNNPDIVYVYQSADEGTTWSGMIAGVGSGINPEYGQISNRDYAPYFTNFAQSSGNVSNDGVTHLVCNGYGEGILPGATDTTNVFPILYWNSNHQNWIAITDPITEAPTDGFGNYVTGGTTTRLYSGNGIGQAYPNVSTSEDGRIIVVVWQGFEYTGEIGNSEWNIFPGNGIFPVPIYYTDLYLTISTNSGVTWSQPEILKGDANVMEQFPYLARRLILENKEAILNYIYQEDAFPGASIFNGGFGGGNEPSDSTRWLYDSYTFSISKVEDEVTIQNFLLEQNFPNPFNPSTTIKYSLADYGEVSLKVYDVLGNELMTLVNEIKAAGTHQVEFDASALTNGVYFYRLKAGNLVQTKKMVLLK